MAGIATRRIISYQMECPDCLEWYPEREMPILWGNHRRCVDCWPRASEKVKHPCILCGATFYNPHTEICHRCTWMDRAIQQRRVTAQNSRARYYNKPATLTLDEWMRTLRDCSGRCVYCLQADYAVVEHYQPVEQAGTTARNCVPACFSCNSRKQQNKTVGIPPKDMERVGQYLWTKP